MADVSRGTYSPTIGIGVFPNAVRQPRNPTSLDVQYPIDQLWLNTVSSEVFYLSSFDSSSGTVLATWTAQGGADSFIVDASTPPGTNPVTPDNAGDITITGGQVASAVVGANAIQTNSLAANSFTIEVQQSGEAASSTPSLNGICHFDSTHFNVSSGFVTLSGGGPAVDSLIPDTGTSPVVPNASGQISVTGQSPANISGIRSTGGTNSLALALFSPFEGDFNFTQSTSPSATNRKIAVANADTSSALSNAQMIMAVGGTSSGDAHNIWSIGSTRAWSLGPDTSDSQNLKLTTAASSSVTPSTGTQVLKINADLTLSQLNINGHLELIGSTTSDVSIQAYNNNTTSTANASVLCQVSGASGGDPYTLYTVPTGSSWITGIDNSSSDIYVIANSTSLGTDNIIEISSLGVDCLQDFEVVRSEPGSLVRSEVNNMSNSADSSAFFLATVQGASAGDPYIRYNVNEVMQWSHGIDNSASDAWVLSRSASPGSNNAISVSTSNAITINSAFTLPTTDGTAGQQLQTNGAGIVTWEAASGGESSVVSSGYTYIGAILMQWGSNSIDPTGTSVAFPISFPNDVFSITLGMRTSSVQSSSWDTPSVSSFIIYSETDTQVIDWIAIGH